MTDKNQDFKFRFDKKVVAMGSSLYIGLPKIIVNTLSLKRGDILKITFDMNGVLQIKFEGEDIVV